MKKHLAELPKRFGEGDIETFAEEARGRAKTLKTFWNDFDPDGRMSLAIGMMIRMARFGYCIGLIDVRHWLHGNGMTALATQVARRVSRVKGKNFKARQNKQFIDTNHYEAQRVIALQEVAYRAREMLDAKYEVQEKIEALQDAVIYAEKYGG